MNIYDHKVKDIDIRLSYVDQPSDDLPLDIFDDLMTHIAFGST